MSQDTAAAYDAIKAGHLDVIGFLLLIRLSPAIAPISSGVLSLHRCRPASVHRVLSPYCDFCPRFLFLNVSLQLSHTSWLSDTTMSQSFKRHPPSPRDSGCSDGQRAGRLWGRRALLHCWRIRVTRLFPVKDASIGLA